MCAPDETREEVSNLNDRKPRAFKQVTQLLIGVTPMMTEELIMRAEQRLVRGVVTSTYALLPMRGCVIR